MYYIRIHSLVGMVSMQAEMVCCRKIVALCQSSLMAGYYYHHLLRPKRYVMYCWLWCTVQHFI